MTRIANDNDFNQAGRGVLMKIEIYFNGPDQTPLVVTRDNYLLSSTLLEEAGTESDWPLGQVSSNEATFVLYNKDGMFNPANASGPYYEKIKTKVKVIPYFKPKTDEVEEWIQMGEYFVTDWLAAITGVTASVTINDKVVDIIADKDMEIPVVKNTTFKAFYEAIFDYFGLTSEVSNYFNTSLPWAFADTSNISVLQDLAIASFGICTSNRVGNMAVKHISESTTVRAILTDGDQVKTADAAQMPEQSRPRR